MSARILVVDDQVANRRLMRARLEAKYYTVSLAENGPQGLRLAEQELPHIILLDVMMPGMDGFEVCRRLKSNPRTQHIPVVILTALSEDEDRVRGLEAGADDFLSKPVDDYALMGRLEALGRYNAVANELRRRDVTSRTVASFTEEEECQLARPGTILLVDEVEASAEAFVQPLKAAGHQLVRTDDGGPQLSRELAPELILLALSGQSYDPLRLCAHLRSLEAAREYSILATYETQDRKRAIQAFGLGASDTIASPPNPLELLARVRTQLRRSRYIEILRQRVDRGLELSMIDQLTDLFNRRYMLNQLEQWIARAAVSGPPVSVIAFDIDHFKSVNDKFGHETGDLVLYQFGRRLVQYIRPKDVACRMGGEEFLIILPETEAKQACIGAERIRKAIAATSFHIERTGQKISVTVSAGVASYNGGDDTVADLLNRADRALYLAKQGGRNRTESHAA